MLDIKFIRDNYDLVKKAIHDKCLDFDLDKLIGLDKKRRQLQKGLDDYRAARRKISHTVANEKDPQKREALIRERQKQKDEMKSIEAEYKRIEDEFNQLLLYVPNIPSPDTPVGPDEKSNQEVERWGEVPQFTFQPKDHIELGLMLNLLDLERGVKVAGFRGYFLKNELAELHLALLLYTYRKMKEKGFALIIPPVLIREFALIGSGHFPFERQEIYEVEEYQEDQTGHKRDIKFLAGTSEPALLAYRAGEILDEAELPLKYAGFSPCYRREVGGYGKDTKGIYRIHEFMKVEQVVICRNNLTESLKLFEEIKDNALDLLRELELPHRVIQICTGDMGAGKYKMYDIETWMPSRQAYSETHSNSHLTDWQARRLNIRYRTKEGRLNFPHTLNNTAIASPRILIAILENYQQADGSIKVPKILQPFLGFDEIKPSA